MSNVRTPSVNWISMTPSSISESWRCISNGSSNSETASINSPFSSSSDRSSAVSTTIALVTRSLVKVKIRSFSKTLFLPKHLIVRIEQYSYRWFLNIILIILSDLLMRELLHPLYLAQHRNFSLHCQTLNDQYAGRVSRLIRLWDREINIVILLLFSL